MIYRDEGGVHIEGIYNREYEWTATRHVIAFEENGLASLTEWLDRTKPEWTTVQSIRESLKSKTWDLEAGYKGALKLAREGWIEGMEGMEKALHAIMPATSHDPRWGWSQIGTSVNVGRYLHGHPKSMRSRRKKQMGSAPVLHIVVNTAASCAIRASQFANYGAAICGLIDRLETMGRRVHLDMVNVGNFSGVRGAYGWNVKSASEHIDLAALSFTLAHPAAFRRLGFAMIERLPKAAECWGYGYCADLVLDDIPNATEGTMLIDGVNHEPNRCNNVTDALRMAIEQVNKAAVIAGHASLDVPLIDEEQAMELLYA